MHTNIFYIILLIICTILSSGYYSSSVDYIQSEKLEHIFKTKLPDNVVYTVVPRGLIISINENMIFNEFDIEPSKNSYGLLDTIADLLKIIPNDVVIENHTDFSLSDEQISNWELSNIRSANLCNYFLKKNISKERIFDIGFGDSMPFKKNVSPIDIKLDNRVDFVIINYEATR